MARMRRYNLFLEEELLADLNAFAKAQHVSASSVIRYAVREHLRKVRTHPASGHAVNAETPPAHVNGL